MSEKLHYRGRIGQISIYLGKMLRMFVYQNDWKVLPMAALIGGLVTFAVGPNMYVTQEGTISGCFALICACVWNGFFNSIQVICRERPIVKREHRSGMHITSYIAAHMIYQMMLCLLQTGIILMIVDVAGLKVHSAGLISKYLLVDMGITMFLTTYAADMLSLAISAFVKNTTAAMTVMPFVMIFQLVFSGGLIPLTGPSAIFTDYTITKWGLQSLCTLGDYNSQPMVTLWNTIWKFRAMEVDGQKPIKLMTDYILKNNKLDEVLLESGMYNGEKAYEYISSNVTHCWTMLGIMVIVFAAAAVIILEFVDKDRR